MREILFKANWPNLIHCGSIHDGEGRQHERVD